MTLTQFFKLCESRQQWRNPFGNEHVVPMEWNPFGNDTTPIYFGAARYPGYPFDRDYMYNNVGGCNDSRGIFWENQER